MWLDLDLETRVRSPSEAVQVAYWYCPSRVIVVIGNGQTEILKQNEKGGTCNTLATANLYCTVRDETILWIVGYGG